jgi:Sap, sulfolipid-1-addressing protein
MGLIFSVVMLGVSASLSPATLVVFIAVLGTARARVNAAAFLTGWMASVAVVFTAGYVLGSFPAIQKGLPRTGLLTLEVLLGCFLAILGGSRWRDRGKGSNPAGAVGLRVLADRFTDMGPGTAALLGVLREPWAITTAAAAVVVHHHAGPIVTLIAFVLFALSSTASVGLMYLSFARNPEEAETRLAHLGDRVTAAGPTVFAAAAMAVGAFLLIDGLIGLMSR